MGRWVGRLDWGERWAGTLVIGHGSEVAQDGVLKGALRQVAKASKYEAEQQNQSH